MNKDRCKFERFHNKLDMLATAADAVWIEGGLSFSGRYTDGLA